MRNLRQYALPRVRGVNKKDVRPVITLAALPRVRGVNPSSLTTAPTIPLNDHRAAQDVLISPEGIKTHTEQPPSMWSKRLKVISIL